MVSISTNILTINIQLSTTMVKKCKLIIFNFLRCVSNTILIIQYLFLQKRKWYVIICIANNSDLPLLNASDIPMNNKSTFLFSTTPDEDVSVIAKYVKKCHWESTNIREFICIHKRSHCTSSLIFNNFSLTKVIYPTPLKNLKDFTYF